LVTIEVCNLDCFVAIQIKYASEYVSSRRLWGSSGVCKSVCICIFTCKRSTHRVAKQSVTAHQIAKQMDQWRFTFKWNKPATAKRNETEATGNID